MPNRDKKNRLFKVSIYFFLFLGIQVFAMNFNPLGLTSATNNSTKDAIYLYLSQFYPDSGRDESLVVLIDDDSITSLYENDYIEANVWPILYLDHAKLLSVILNNNPKAIFIDLDFFKERSTDETIVRAINKLKNAVNRNSADTPAPDIFIASGLIEDEHASGHNVNCEDSQLFLIDKITCQNSPLKLHSTINGWNESFGSYPLQVEFQDLTCTKEDKDELTCKVNNLEKKLLCDSEYTDCSSEKTKQSFTCKAEKDTKNHICTAENKYRDTPAYALYKTACKDQESNKSKCKDFKNFSQENNVSVIWGTQKPEVVLSGLQSNEGCESYNFTLGDLFNKTERIKCSYQNVVDAFSLVNAYKSDKSNDQTDLKNAIEGKIIFYGVDISGWGDRITTLANGNMPGVLYHAMAFDNLMAFGNEHIKTTNNTTQTLNYIYLIILCLVTAFITNIFCETFIKIFLLASLLLASGSVLFSSVPESMLTPGFQVVYLMLLVLFFIFTNTLSKKYENSSELLTLNKNKLLLPIILIVAAFSSYLGASYLDPNLETVSKILKYFHFLTWFIFLLIVIPLLIRIQFEKSNNNPLEKFISKVKINTSASLALTFFVSMVLIYLGSALFSPKTPIVNGFWSLLIYLLLISPVIIFLLNHYVESRRLVLLRETTKQVRDWLPTKKMIYLLVLTWLISISYILFMFYVKRQAPDAILQAPVFSTLTITAQKLIDILIDKFISLLETIHQSLRLWASRESYSPRLMASQKNRTPHITTYF